MGVVSNKSTDAYIIGNMRDRGTLQSVARVSDDQGGFTETWSDVTSVWMWIRPIKSYERMQMGQLQTPVTHRITTRFRSDVKDTQRFVVNNRVFNIKEIINLEERDAFLEIKALELQ